MKCVSLLVLAAVCFGMTSGDIIIEYFRRPKSEPAQKLPPPPAINDAARYARYVVHYSEWTSVGHISHQKETDWYPSSRVFSMADGTIEYSSGIPYIYTSDYDSAPRDLEKDPRCSMTMSLAQTEFCSSRGYDPEDPRCPQVILTGHFEKVKNNTSEWEFAKNALFTRHPEMKTWPYGHHFFFAKLNIRHVQLVDNIGGSKYPNVSDYFNSPPPMMHSRKSYLRPTVFEESNGLDSSEAKLLEDIQVNMVEQ